jgi:tetratricopeptide (TPR) repeat protein
MSYRKGAVAAGLLVFLLAILLYANTLDGQFVFDDLQNVVENRWIRSVSHLPEVFSTHAAGFDEGRDSSYYRPLLHVAYLTTYAIFGLRPWAFHLVNILMHATVSVLVFLTTLRLVTRFESRLQSQPVTGAILALAPALVFASHPVHTESVAWIAGLTDLSYALFFMWGFLAYTRRGLPDTVDRIISAVFLFLAALCKEPALSLPIVLLAYEWIFFPARPRIFFARAARNLLPQAIAAALYLMLRVLAMGGFAPSELPIDLSAGQLFLNASVLFGDYLRLLVAPIDLTAIHGWSPVLSVWTPRAVVGLLLPAVLAVTMWTARRRPLVAMGTVLVLVPLAPALYVPALGADILAERYLYLPTWGFGLLVGCLGAEIVLRAPRLRAAVVVGILLLLSTYSVATVARNAVWRDSLTLWTDAARKAPDSAVAQEYLGFALLEAGRYEESIRANERALVLDDRRANAMVNAGVAYFMIGHHSEAGTWFERAIQTRPGLAEAHSGLGDVLRVQGQTLRAIEVYRQALSLNPTHASAHQGLAIALWASGDPRGALREFEEASRLDPENPQIRENLRRARAAIGGAPADPSGPME